MSLPKPTFEQCYKEIKKIVDSKSEKWQLTSIQWIDFEDISSIIVNHIYKKWYLWDHSRPLGPWVSKIVNNQMSNLIRNHYSSFSRPCLKCEYNDGDNSCSLYETQCDNCPLFAKWKKFKKRAYDIKIPLPIDNHEQEVQDILHQDGFDLEKTSEKIHEIMEKELKPLEWKIYNLMFIQDMNEKQVAEALEYKTSEENRIAGYRTIYMAKKKIIEIVKNKIKNNEIDY